MAQMQIGAIDTIRLARDASPRVRTAAVELARWIERLGARKPTIGADAGDVTALLSTNATDLEPEHFCIEVESAKTLHITGGDGHGVLYGVQECIDRARLGRAIMTMTDGPHFALRSVDMWETPSSMVWCLPFDSILDYDKMLRPEEIPEYLDFARRLLAMRVNSLTLFSQYASRGSLFERWLSHAEPVERFAQFMDRFGVSIRLALHYTSPDESGHYVTLCPYSDHIREQWKDFVARMAVAMPTVRNFRLRGAGEEAPGPHEDDCDRCAATPLRERVLAGIRVVSDAVATLGGDLIWLTGTDQAAHASAEAEMYGDWGDDFPENVRIAHCHNYWDHRPPYPPHPIWSHSG
ncbi:MAG: hypothetical protein F4191_05760, partial [Rhodothermaceae bacterium]|nr:hypothetical protein [Rhodothermaceae bacterium]